VAGEGVGTHLLAAFESEATERGATQVFARAEPGDRAESFLRRPGLDAGGPAPDGPGAGRSRRLTSSSVRDAGPVDRRSSRSPQVAANAS
jgi:hypothetical protein